MQVAYESYQRIHIVYIFSISYIVAHILYQLDPKYIRIGMTISSGSQ